MKEVYYVILLFFVYSFLGWSMEVICKLIEKHRFINRGFFIGPYCPIYGFGSILIIMLLDRYKSNSLELFLMSMVICSILEYYTSYFMEKLFDTRWWDYSDRKFNINGRICLNTMIPFGILGTSICYIINPFFVSLIDLIPINFIKFLDIFLVLIFICDAFISLKIIINYKDTISKIEKDNTEEVSKKVRSILFNKGIFHKRLIKAFPNLKNTKEYLIELESSIQKKIKDFKK